MYRTSGFAVIAIAWLGGSAAAAPEARSFGEHAVVSPARRTVYVMTSAVAGPVLAAIDVATGKPRWTASGAAKPIGLRGDRLAALDGSGKLVVVDARTGKPAAGCASIPGVVTPFFDGLGSNSSASGTDDGTTLLLVWSRSTHYAGGAAPPPDIEAAARSQSSGAFEIDLAACKARPLPHALATVFSPASDITITTPTGKTARITRGAAGIWIARAGGKPIDATEGDAQRTQLTLSVDQQFAFVGDGAMPPKLAMFDLETGAVTHPRLPELPYVALSLGGTILLSSSAISAYDVATGKATWTVQVHDTHYHGPYPP